MAMTHPLILVIDGDPSIRNYLRATLQGSGYHVQEAATAEQGLALITMRSPDLVLLDLGLPDLDGLVFARRLRGWSRVPIIVLSGRRKEDDLVLALDAGADDFLAKPFGSGELLARIRVALRHAGEAAYLIPAGTTALGSLKVNYDSREVTVGGHAVHLSPNEFTLLTTLLKHAGRVLTHQQLLQEVNGAGPPPHSANLLRVYMANLRKKLEADPARPRLLVTEPGVGYRLQDHGISNS
jgi:two-component system KDP operon response regulator KdpE